MNQYERRFYEDIHKLVSIQEKILKEIKKMNEPIIEYKEKPKEQEITIEEIKNLYEELDNRECGDSYFIKHDGTRIVIDTGYAFEGIKLFIEELEHKLELKEKESD